ncbi:MAG: hypothetical protein HY744_22850, partial [Deltaproteobacteria bacterium]|nr:hypothetical protein [Deltaproteobacteria bacterium]
MPVEPVRVQRIVGVQGAQQEDGEHRVVLERSLEPALECRLGHQLGRQHRRECFFHRDVRVHAYPLRFINTTDILAEGMNLQQCRHIINFDLPWNPMRLVQRHGRVDRIGSPHDTI